MKFQFKGEHKGRKDEMIVVGGGAPIWCYLVGLGGVQQGSGQHAREERGYRLEERSLCIKGYSVREISNYRVIIDVFLRR